MSIEKLRPSFSFDEERLKGLKQVVPEAFADGKINWEVLKEALGEHLEDESGEVEHFGFFWPGKKEARRIASIPSKGTLVPVYGEGLKADGTPDTDGVNDSHNIFIEGENLEVLKILQKSYAGRIKMIYIDPPYNTGNDFIYDDNFTEPLQEYLRRTGQIDEEGKAFTTNKRSDGRFHSKWLSMIYPRLRLARNLLHDDGVIFVSIDDNEVHNLKGIMNEVFGEENFVAQITRATGTPTGGGGAKPVVNEIDYLLAYSKSENSKFTGTPLTEEESAIYDKEDEDGIYLIRPLRRTGGEDRREDRPTMYFPLSAPDGTDVYPIAPAGYESRWICGKEKYEELKEQNLIEWKQNGNNDWNVYQKFYLEGRLKQPGNLWIKIEGNKKATRDVRDLFDGKKIFDFPKPVGFIAKILQISTGKKDLILDFFAGSGSTAHAVMDLNKEDGGNRRFIMVQMPELCDEKSEAFKAGYKNIAEIGKERIRRVVKKLKETTPTDKLTNQDLGFKSLKLSTSNFKLWNNTSKNKTTELQGLFEQYQSSTVEGSRAESLINEIMLLEGFTLDSRIYRISELKSNEVKRISSKLNDHQLIVCIDERIKEDTINKLALGENDIFICLDTAISDQDKLRLSDKGLIKTI